MVEKLCRTKTYADMVRKVASVLGFGITTHPPTPDNPLGQSGVHTFCEDVMDVILTSENEAQAYKRLLEYLHNGEMVIRPYMERD